MRISDSAYMSVEAMARLAAQHTDNPCSAKGLAEWINCPVSYTEALLAQLCKAGLVVSPLGRGGGYALARPAHRITVADVFEAVGAIDAPPDVANRPLDADTFKHVDTRELQGADLLWEALKSCVLSFLNGVSLADLAPATASPVSDRAGFGDPFHAGTMNATLRH